MQDTMSNKSDPASSPTVSWSPIGTVACEVDHTEIKKRRKTIVSKIVVFEEFQDGLKGITDYSHLMIIFWMHKRKNNPQLIGHPRGNEDYPTYGAFAYRGTNHPNPIGLAVVELLECTNNCIIVKGLDAFDKTPVIDIKPYDHFDIVQKPKVPEWFRARLEAPCHD